MSRKRQRLLTIALGLVLCPAAAWAAPPDSERNPVTGDIETVDQVIESSNRNVRHVSDPGPGPGEVTVLTGHGDDDNDPRITITPDGNSWVVWWRDSATDGVFFRRLDASVPEWTAESRISEPGESSSHPAVVNDGTHVWVAFEIANGSDTDVGITGVGHDEPSPFPGRTIIATTSYGGDLDVTVHYDSGALWVTWVASASDVGWSEYDSTTETWSAAADESYASDTVADARDRIRTTVLN